MAPHHAPFITDMGAPQEMRSDDGATLMIERYGAWVWDPAKGKHQVAEVSNDLAALQKTYGVPDERVFSLTTGKAGGTPTA